VLSAIRLEMKALADRNGDAQREANTKTKTHFKAKVNHSGQSPLFTSMSEYGGSGPCLRMAWAETDNPVL